jgi:hypothetical protein
MSETESKVRDIDSIKAEYGTLCARLGDLVVQQRRLHDAAEHVIKTIELLEQEARAITAASEPTKGAE